MPPKKNTRAAPSFLEDLDLPFDVSKLSDDGNLIVSILMFTVKDLQSKFDDTLKELQDKNDRETAARDKIINDQTCKINKLEERIERLEQKEDAVEAAAKKSSIIISGDNIPTVPQGSSDEDCISTAHQFMRDTYRLPIAPADVIFARRIGKKPPVPNPDKRSILVKLSSEETKKKLFDASKSLKPQDVYLREDLTKTRNSILYVLRKAKQYAPEVVSGCTSIDGNVYAWLKAPNPTARDSRMEVNTFAKLDKFCTDILKQPPSTFAPDWNQ